MSGLYGLVEPEDRLRIRITGVTTVSAKVRGCGGAVFLTSNQRGISRSWVGKRSETSFGKKGQLGDAVEKIRFQKKKPTKHASNPADYLSIAARIRHRAADYRRMLRARITVGREGVATTLATSCPMCRICSNSMAWKVSNPSTTR